MGDGMKRAAVILGILSLAIPSIAVWAEGQSGQPAQQNPAAGQAAPAQGAPVPPLGKRPPQAKTQPEFDAWKAASASTDVATLEKASDDFATKFPDSEIRILLYQNAMRLYQNANNAEKTEAMGRKVLSLDGDNPEALVMVAEVIAERTRDSDIDKDQRFGEATSMAQKALQTVDTDISVPAGTPQEKIDAYTSDPAPVDILRLALALDKQGKYPEALKVANRVVEMTKDDTVVGTTARHERDRLQQLTGGAAPAQPQSPPKN